jgi:hypothetical protein
LNLTTEESGVFVVSTHEELLLLASVVNSPQNTSVLD